MQDAQTVQHYSSTAPACTKKKLSFKKILMLCKDFIRRNRKEAHFFSTSFPFPALPHTVPQNTWGSHAMKRPFCLFGRAFVQGTENTGHEKSPLSQTGGLNPNGGLPETRTPNLLIKSQLLYQLS